MGAGDRPHEQDDGRDHQGRSDDQCAVGDRRAAEAGVDHAAADGHQHQEEGAEQLGEQAPALVAAVQKSNSSSIEFGVPSDRRSCLRPPSV
jgi:hypothetical protein